MLKLGEQAGLATNRKIFNEKGADISLTMSPLKKSGWVDLEIFWIHVKVVLRGRELGVCLVDMKFRFVCCLDFGWR